MKTGNIKKRFKKLEDIIHFSNLDENHELFSKEKQENEW